MTGLWFISEDTDSVTTQAKREKRILIDLCGYKVNKFKKTPFRNVIGRFSGGGGPRIKAAARGHPYSANEVLRVKGRSGKGGGWQDR